MPWVIDSFVASASPLSRMLAAMRVKSPFSQSARFGFIAFVPLRWVVATVIVASGLLAASTKNGARLTCEDGRLRAVLPRVESRRGGLPAVDTPHPS